MKHMLITGAAGFIGGNFSVHIADRRPDLRLTLLDKLSRYSSMEQIRPLLESGRAEFVRVDLADNAALERLFGSMRFDAVVNFAAESHNDRAIRDSRPFVNSNVVGAYNLLEACRLHGTGRMVQVSTIEVYGEQAQGVPWFTEGSPLNAKTPYSASKAAADLLVRSHMLTYPNLDVAITHCANNYGPWQFPEKLLPLAITNILTGKKVPLYGDGRQRRDWLHVRDHCRGVELVLDRKDRGLLPGSESDPGRLPIFDFSARMELTNRELVHLVAAELGVEADRWIEYVADRPNHDRRYLINPAKAEETLGFSPSISLERGIADTVAWYVDNRAWWEPLKGEAGRLDFNWSGFSS